jgi:ribonuclease D
MLKFLLKLNADMHNVAPKLIAGKDELQDLAQGHFDGNPVLKGWRHDVFGKDAMDLIHGRLKLSLKKGEIIKHTS